MKNNALILVGTLFTVYNLFSYEAPATSPITTQPPSYEQAVGLENIHNSPYPVPANRTSIIELQEVPDSSPENTSHTDCCSRLLKCTVGTACIAWNSLKLITDIKSLCTTATPEFRRKRIALCCCFTVCSCGTGIGTATALIEGSLQSTLFPIASSVTCGTVGTLGALRLLTDCHTECCK